MDEDWKNPCDCGEIIDYYLGGDLLKDLLEGVERKAIEGLIFGGALFWSGVRVLCNHCLE